MLIKYLPGSLFFFPFSQRKKKGKKEEIDPGQQEEIISNLFSMEIISISCWESDVRGLKVIPTVLFLRELPSRQLHQIPTKHPKVSNRPKAEETFGMCLVVGG